MRNNKGFTLVELAIVLVIIGVILGGVMKGQQLVASARAKRIMRDFQTFQTAFFAYQDRTGRLPGDDDAANATGNITTDALATNFWADLRRVDLIPTAATTSDNPVDVYGGAVTIGNTDATTAGLGVNAICFANVPVAQAEAIDRSNDDNNFATGDIQVGDDITAAIANAAAAAGANVVVCIRLEQ